MSDAKGQAAGAEEAEWDAILAGDPTPMCPRCGSPRAIPGEGCFTCRVLDENARKEGKTPEEIDADFAIMRRGRKRFRAERAVMPAKEREEQELEARARLERKLAGELPPNIPPLEPAIVLPCEQLAADGPFKKTQLRFTAQGIRCQAPKSAAPSFWMPWNAIDSVTVEAADTVRERATLPRIAAGGIFALGFKKKFEKSYVIVHLSHGAEDIFEITGYNQMQTRATLSPVMAWLQNYGEAVRAHAAP